MNKNPLKKIVTLQKEGQQIGIYSACSANEFVVRAVIEKAKEDNSFALIESTANQVDQYGGYTGMKPKDFKAFVTKIANEIGLSMEHVFLGGDHLGPLTWTHLNEEEAMENAKELIRQYVLAGFTKIHIDASMKVKSDNQDLRLADEIIANRGAILAKVANEAYQELLKEDSNAIQPVYIVGSEVPIPGGAQGSNMQELQVTTTEDFINTVDSFKTAFKNHQIDVLWDDVIAIVVQPGVEEKDAGCVEYNREKAKHLKQAIKAYPSLVFEGHSTDYQTKIKLKEMVEDGIAVLKVGPGLTFTMREAMFSLAHIESEIFENSDITLSYFIEKLDEEMLKNPEKWQKYYTGTPTQIKLKRKYSFSDRCRYYLPTPIMEDATAKLILNLSSLEEIPLNLLSQYMPLQYTKVREGQLNNDVHSLIIDRIKNTISEYTYATNQHLIK